MPVTRYPIWLRTAVISAIFAVAGWAAKDRLSIEKRITRIETFVSDVSARLDRIENKLDRALEKQP